MREANSRELLRLLRQNCPCSRADLVRLSGLTAPTVSAAIDSLHERGLVKFIGSGQSNGGRPPRILEFNASHAYVVGADIGGSTIRLALTDLHGKVLSRWSRNLGRDRSPEAITKLIAIGIDELRKEHSISARRILELAAGAPGVTDVRNGIVLSAPNLTGWSNVPLRDMLRHKTGVPTTIENDVNLAALGESWCGVAREVRNFVFLAVGTGVGAGLVIGGQLYHGSAWSAGEVGYMMLPGLPTDPLSMSRLGALESAIGGPSIEREWARRMNGNGKASLKATDIFEKAAVGDGVASELLEKAAEHLATAISNMSLVLDMSLVVLGGGVANRALLSATNEVLSRNQFGCPEVVLSSLGADAQLYGAVWLALTRAEAHGFQRQTARRVGPKMKISQITAQ